MYSSCLIYNKYIPYNLSQNIKSRETAKCSATVQLYFITSEKPGECPVLPPDTVGHCSDFCSGDDSCAGTQKCCSNGCGHVCARPTLGTCRSCV